MLVPAMRIISVVVTLLGPLTNTIAGYGKPVDGSVPLEIAYVIVELATKIPPEVKKVMVVEVSFDQEINRKQTRLLNYCLVCTIVMQVNCRIKHFASWFVIVV